LKHSLALAACLIVFAVPAKAQPLLLPPPAYAHVVPMAALAPHEIALVMRSGGLRPLHRPVRQGRVYVVRAINPRGEEVGAVVDARSGRILRINPMLIPPNALPVGPAPYGRPPERMVASPDGTMSGLLAELPPPAAPGSSASMPRAAAGAPSPPQVGAPPLPRPRPKVAATQAPARTAIDAQPPTSAVAPPIAAPAQPSAPAIAAAQSKTGEGSATSERAPETTNPPATTRAAAASSQSATPVEQQE
jgi:hypothetical protein